VRSTGGAWAWLEETGRGALKGAAAETCTVSTHEDYPVNLAAKR
jgi:hypothetical protein